jgi:hypothetical protein
MLLGAGTGSLRLVLPRVCSCRGSIRNAIRQCDFCKSKSGHSQIVKKLASGASVKEMKDGASAIVWTAELGHKDIVKILVPGFSIKQQSSNDTACSQVPFASLATT